MDPNDNMRDHFEADGSPRAVGLRAAADLLSEVQALRVENAALRSALEKIQTNDPEANRLHADEIANAALDLGEVDGRTRDEPGLPRY